MQHDFQILVLAQAADHQWQLAIEHRRYETDGKNSLAVGGDTPGIGDGGFDLVQNLLGMGEEVGTPRRQLQTPGLADEQLDANLLFQLFDGSGQGRLGDKQLFRGAGEIALFRHCDEITQVS